jgi:hypothetical protein
LLPSQAASHQRFRCPFNHPPSRPTDRPKLAFVLRENPDGRSSPRQPLKLAFNGLLEIGIGSGIAL